MPLGPVQSEFCSLVYSQTLGSVLGFSLPPPTQVADSCQSVAEEVEISELAQLVLVIWTLQFYINGSRGAQAVIDHEYFKNFFFVFSYF